MSRDFSHVNDEAAYFKAMDQRIKANARKGRNQRWLAEDASREALMRRLENEARGEFMLKMLDSYDHWGSLTAGQEAAVRRVFDQNDSRKAEYKARDAASCHVGTIGERRIFTATVRNVITFENDFGVMSINIMTEGENIIVYKGTGLRVEKGQQVTFKATIKEHGARDGVAQTIVNRPKLEGSWI